MVTVGPCHSLIDSSPHKFTQRYLWCTRCCASHCMWSDEQNIKIPVTLTSWCSHFSVKCWKINKISWIHNMLNYLRCKSKIRNCWARGDYKYHLGSQRFIYWQGNIWDNTWKCWGKNQVHTGEKRFQPAGTAKHSGLGWAQVRQVLEAAGALQAASQWAQETAVEEEP